MADMYKIWNEIPKPEEFKDQPCSKYFKFEFLTLAHKFYKTEEFNQGIEEIKERLKRNKDDMVATVIGIEYDPNSDDGNFEVDEG